MINAVKWLFDCKKHPANVFIIAFPLFLIGMGSCLWIAWHYWSTRGDFVYALIVFGGLILLAFGLWPIRKPLMQLTQPGSED